MARQYSISCIAVILLILFHRAMAVTDPLDVTALRALYSSLNQPPQLTGWRMDGGDPCDDTWNGVACSESSVIYLKLPALNLSGSVTPEIYNLYNLKQLDISSNSITGQIPYVLPPNATHINLACNFFTQNIPQSLPGMRNLRHLNLSHNWLSGPIGSVFTGLENLRELDLSYNNFSGDLPSSLGSLRNLTALYLEHNLLNGTVDHISNLTKLKHLDLQANGFTGRIPDILHRIPDLRIAGNTFETPEPAQKENKWILYFVALVVVLLLVGNHYGKELQELIPGIRVVEYEIPVVIFRDDRGEAFQGDDENAAERALQQGGHFLCAGINYRRPLPPPPTPPRNPTARRNQLPPAPEMAPESYQLEVQDREGSDSVGQTREAGMGKLEGANETTDSLSDGNEAGMSGISKISKKRGRDSDDEAESGPSKQSCK